MNRFLENRLLKVLNHFNRIGLDDFGDHRFSERIDRKFPLNLSEVPSVLEGLESYYDLITPADLDICTIESHYFDTPDFEYFRTHHRGKALRHKVRFRVYPETKTAFLEVKWKTIKGKTMKQRIETALQKLKLDSKMIDFLEDSGIEESEKIEPVLDIAYRRLSFISKDRAERFSVDFAVEYTDGESSGDFGSMAIVEVKQGRLKSTPIIKRLKEERIRESSLSKYCLSICQLNPNLKANRFKPVLRNLQEFIHEENHISKSLL